MPVVYSPGEAETRPLDPDGIVYTTAQKVADLIGIGPGEAVAASANTEADRVYVTGADYRDHGFAVGDTILIYSDAQALGVEKTLTAVSEGGANGVALYFTGDNISNISDYQTADNTYIQNTASFTNGKTSGVKRSHVETIIKEMQDRIDNKTHNAWRPYLVAAEYINFDTYKPYRRRYYTDYVGTTPLLFRNVQQILRIELWQGDDYRELAGAEVRLEIADYTGLSDNTLTVGGGSYNNDPTITHTASANIMVGMGVSGTGIPAGATVSSITSPTVFELSASTTGGSLSGQTLTFSESESVFLCPGGGGFAKLAVGTGTQQWQAGFNKVTTAQNLADLINREDRTNRGTVTFTTNADSPSGTTYTLPDGSSSTGTTNVYVHNEFLATANADYGSGKLKITSKQPPGGEEATIAVTDTTSMTLAQTNSVEGTGTIDKSPSDGSRTITFTDSSGFAEYGVVRASTGTVYGYTSNTGTVLQGCRALHADGSVSDDAAYTWTQHKFDADLGFYSDTSGDQARLKDWWLDHEMGIIYFNNSYPYFEWNAVKVSYIYGERYVEKAIEQAATKMVACDLLMADDRSVLIPEGTQNVDLASKIQLWRQEAEAILRRYKEVVVFG